MTNDRENNSETAFVSRARPVSQPDEVKADEPNGNKTKLN
jgi:hypothetical protein